MTLAVVETTRALPLWRRVFIAVLETTNALLLWRRVCIAVVEICVHCCCGDLCALLLWGLVCTAAVDTCVQCCCGDLCALLLWRLACIAAVENVYFLLLQIFDLFINRSVLVKHWNLQVLHSMEFLVLEQQWSFLFFWYSLKLPLLGVQKNFPCFQITKVYRACGALESPVLAEYWSFPILGSAEVYRLCRALQFLVVAGL